jgi:NADPH-dependent curcumin reductase CurA
MPLNHQILLVSRPTAQAGVDNFQLVETQTPALQDGQVLVRHHYLSLDPYMRGRMNDAKSYAAAAAARRRHGWRNGGRGRRIPQRPPTAVGDKVVGMGGWQEYSVVDGTRPGVLRKVDTTHVPLSPTWARSACRASPPGTGW